MRLPSFKSLRTFQVAARHGSFKLAAGELFLTASAVSHQIKGLESQLGVALFERGVRALKLTDAGRHYLDHLEDMFAKLESVTQQLRERFGRSIIRLNVPSFFAHELLLPRLAGFAPAREGTDIRIETALNAERTHPPEADLSIVVGVGPWEGLCVHTLFSQSFITACAPAYRLENPVESIADLARGTLLVHEDRRDAWDRWAMSLGLDAPNPQRLVRLDTMSAVVRAAEEGVGVALIPARLSAERFTSGALVRLFEAEFETQEQYVLLHRPEDAERAELRELTEWIVSICRVA